MIEHLPMEVFLYLAIYLTFESIKKCREVSSSLQTVIENSGLLSSAEILVNPENEERIIESKLFSIVNKIRITKFRREQSVKVDGILKQILEKINHCSFKHLFLDCSVYVDSSLLSSFFSKLQTIQLQLETIEDTVLVGLMNEFFHKSDFTLDTLILSCRVINTTIYKSEIFSSMKSLNMVNGKIEMEHIDSLNDSEIGSVNYLAPPGAQEVALSFRLSVRV